MDFGTFTNINPETGEKIELKIINYVRTPFPDGREVTVMELDGGSMFLQVTNPEDSGRNPMNSIWLSKESYMALGATMALHNDATGTSTEEFLNDFFVTNKVHFNYSPNLSFD